MTTKALLFAAATLGLPGGMTIAQTSPAATPPTQQATPTTMPPAQQTPTMPTQQTPPAGDATPAPTGPVDTGSDAQAGTTAQTSTTQGTATATVVAATQADLKAGAVVNDQSGQKVGTIESVASDGAVVSTGKSRAQVPLSGFGTKNGALVIGMTKAQLDAAAAAKTPSSGK